MIELNITEQQLKDVDELKYIVSQLISLKLFDKKSEKAFGYYRGDLPKSVSNDNSFNPRTFNFAKPITDIATKVFIGETPDIVTYGNKSEKDKITNFKRKLFRHQFDTQLYQTGKHSSICGSGYLALYNEIGDTFPRFRTLNPQFCDVVYDTTLSHKRLLAFNIIENQTLVNDTFQSNYIVYVYTKDKLYAFETQDTQVSDPKQPMINKDFVTPLMAFRSSNGEESYFVNHNFNDIPIVEFPNNEEYKGDFECVIDLFNAYNDLQNNRLQNVNDIVQYVLMIKNARVGNNEESAEMVSMLKKDRILALEGENVDAKFLSNPLDQAQMQTLANDIKECIHYISRVPDLSSVDFSQNASDPILKIKTKPLIDLCDEKELSFTPNLLLVLEMVLDYCKRFDKADFDKYSFDLEIIDLEYAHELPSNDLDMITQIANLSNSGILNPEQAMQHISWCRNPHEYMKGANKWNEIVDKRKNSVKNSNTNQVANETNIERQNANPVSKNELDNVRNGAIGMGDKISDNKVE